MTHRAEPDRRAERLLHNRPVTTIIVGFCPSAGKIPGASDGKFGCSAELSLFFRSTLAPLLRLTSAIVTTLCPGSKERMRRLMAMAASQRMDLTPLVTHAFHLADIRNAYELFSGQLDGVMKIALFPQRIPERRKGRQPATVALGAGA